MQAKGRARFFVVLFLLLGMLNPLFSRAGEDKMAGLIEGAKKEGQMVFYAAMNVDDSNRMLVGFEKKYPFIKTKLFRLGSTQLLTKMLAEKRAGFHNCDVVTNNLFEFDVKTKEGMLGKYMSPEAKAIPAIFKDPAGYWASLYLQPFGITYNTRLVAPQDVPKGYADLLHPRWKGKMSLDRGDESWLAGIIHIMGEEKGLNYARKMAEQNINFRSGHTLLLQMLAAGEFSLDINSHVQRAERNRHLGAPLDWVAPEPSLVSYNPIGITANPPHPNAAKLFVDYTLSREGQRIVRDIGRPPARSDVEPMYPRLAKYAKGEIKVLPIAIQWAEHYKEYSDQFESIFLKKGGKH